VTVPLRADADGMFADFGETVVYRPLGGRPRSIEAVVDRQPPAPIEGAPGGVRPTMVIVVKNDEQEGIGSREIDTGGDRVEAPPRVGEKPLEFRILEVGQNDAGTLELRVQ